MRRTIKNMKTEILKKRALKQARELRAKLEEEHGDVFNEIKAHAQAKHAESTGQPIEIQNIPVDRQKNLETVMKFMESRGEDASADDAFSNKVKDILNQRR